MRTANQFFASTMGGESVPFITVWKTDNTSAGSSASNQVKLPLFSTGIYNFSVDWGDSSSDIITSWNQAETTHTYASPGTYTVSITRTCRGFRFANGGDRLKILDIEQWGGFINLVSNDVNTGSFQGCENLDVTATDIPKFQAGRHRGFFRGCSSLVGTAAFANWNLSGVTSFARFFQDCALFNQPINTWNLSSCTELDSMFINCTAFNQNIGSWNVSNVTNFSQLFYNASSFNQNIGSWDTSSATDFGSMFRGASVFNQDIGSWDVSNVSVFAELFYNAAAFNQNIGSWNVSATSAIRMFRGAAAFNQPIGSWDVSNVVDFTQMFFGATNFNQDIGSWNVGNGTNFSLMFRDATNFNQNIGSWNVSNGINFSEMFYTAISFNQDIGSWDVSNGTGFIRTFRDAAAFNQNIGSWNVSKANDFTNFMFGKTDANYSAINLDAIYNGWSALTFVNTGLNISFGTIKYTAASSAGRAILTSAPNNWTITDGGI